MQNVVDENNKAETYSNLIMSMMLYIRFVFIYVHPKFDFVNSLPANLLHSKNYTHVESFTNSNAVTQQLALALLPHSFDRIMIWGGPAQR